eukprot:Rhum_TRINITY_DN19038_c0_g1::Rhum_TRINITY_DN19038_c0_g1_i1::g.169117::m.169117
MSMVQVNTMGLPTAAPIPWAVAPMTQGAVQGMSIPGMMLGTPQQQHTQQPVASVPQAMPGQPQQVVQWITQPQIGTYPSQQMPFQVPMHNVGQMPMQAGGQMSMQGVGNMALPPQQTNLPMNQGFVAPQPAQMQAVAPVESRSAAQVDAGLASIAQMQQQQQQQQQQQAQAQAQAQQL